MRGVFISYRRDDSAGHAGRIHDRLAEHYGHERVFRDVEDIGVGDNFVEVIDDAVGKCDVLVVVIGPNWLSITDESGRRRLEDPDDVLRLEIESALERPDIRLIPVLVNGAVMPKAAELPDEIRDLATRNALEIRDTRFADDLKQLIAAIGGRRTRRRRQLALAGGLVVFGGAAAIVALLLFDSGPQVAADITLYQGGGRLPRVDTAAIVPIELPDSVPEPAIENRALESVEPPSAHTLTVDYRYERTGKNRVRIASVLPYRQLLARGGPLIGGRTEIAWGWPRLSVKIVNATDQPLLLQEVRLKVKRSEVDTEPIVMINSGTQSLSISNQGWGRIVDPSVRIAVVESGECADTIWRSVPLTRLDIEDASVRAFGSGAGTEDPEPGDPGTTMVFQLSEHVPPEFEDWQPACVVGRLDYRNEDGRERNLRFKTRIRLYAVAAAAGNLVWPSVEYYVFLEAGKADTVVSRSIEIGLEPGEFAHFLLRIGTDRSAEFDIDVELTAAGGEAIPVDEVRLQMLTPVSDPDGLRDPRRH